MAKTLRPFVLIIFFWGAFAPSTSFAQTRDLKWDPTLDGIVTGVSLLSWISMETILKEPFAPKKCRWCEPPAFDTYFRDRILTRGARSRPKLVSDINLGVSAAVAYGGLSVLSVLSGSKENIAVDALLLTETLAITMVITNVVKWTVARRRPPESHDAFGNPNAESNLSFFSGHTSFTTAVGTAAGTIAILRGYQWGPQLLATGITVGFATAIARIATDAHYFSDVAAGFLIGGGLGLAIPLIFHSREPSDGSSGRSDSQLSFPLFQIGSQF